MARLASQAKKGFYPAPDIVSKMIGDKLVGAGPKTTIFDPCAGEGLAVAAIADVAGINRSGVYASELDIERSATLKSNLQGSVVYGPVDFLGAFHYGRASVVYCNPPYDDELGGGGRLEWKFIERAIESCAKDGLVVIIIPESVAAQSRTGSLLFSRMSDIQVFPFPSEVRHFDEVVIFGRPREKMVRADSWWRLSDYMVDYAAINPVELVGGSSVVVRKVEYTDQELSVELGKINAHAILNVKRRDRSRLVRPPMEMRKGHQAMLLASGFLDGIVDIGDGHPHVVRGSAVKRTEKKEERTDTGIKVTETERIYLVVKVATDDGRVITLTDRVAEDSEAEELEEIEAAC